MHLATFSLIAAAMTVGADARELWSSQPAGYAQMRSSQYILKTGYPVGNGKLGGKSSFTKTWPAANFDELAIPFGPPGAEKVNVNIDSLWSGGPFQVDVSCCDRRYIE
jgi:alpha-L-fucosidase 2